MSAEPPRGCLAALFGSGGARRGPRGLKETDGPATPPAVGLELDDTSHQLRDRVERDAFVNALFASASLPLLRLPARQSYLTGQIAAAIDGVLLTAATDQDTRLERGVSEDAPACPSCGVAMVHRTAGKGRHAGGTFFGCPNYPRCREILRLERGG
jgi:Protein of unknown function (DUF2726)/Topoisomerase DNA binding C4 zinc finger